VGFDNWDKGFDIFRVLMIPTKVFSGFDDNDKGLTG